MPELTPDQQAELTAQIARKRSMIRWCTLTYAGGLILLVLLSVPLWVVVLFGALDGAALLAVDRFVKQQVAQAEAAGWRPPLT